MYRFRQALGTAAVGDRGDYSLLYLEHFRLLGIGLSGYNHLLQVEDQPKSSADSQHAGRMGYNYHRNKVIVTVCKGEVPSYWCLR